MKKYTSLVFFLLMTIVTNKMVAQDIHFSQFYANPLSLNPALTGWYDGDIRIVGNYRTQWKSIDNKPFNTLGFGVEKQYHHFFSTYSFGLQILSDESGYVGLQVSKLLLSGAFSTIYNENTFSGGIQVGGVHKATNTMRYTYDDQFDLGGNHVFNPNIETNEVGGEPVSYVVANAGIMWKRRITNKIIPEIGISVFNLNTPYETFYNRESEQSTLPIKSFVYIGGTYQILPKILLCPTILYASEKKATEFLIGGNVEYKYSKEISPFVGTEVRYGLKSNFDASSWVVGVQYKKVRVGLSYDVNISGLKTATNNRGAFEVSIIYITPSVKSTFIKIPCDRI